MSRELGRPAIQGGQMFFHHRTMIIEGRPLCCPMKLRWAIANAAHSPQIEKYISQFVSRAELATNLVPLNHA